MQGIYGLMVMERTSRYFTALAAAAGFFVTATVSAQTLTVTYPDGNAVSPRISDLHGSPVPTGPTVIHHPVVPAQGGGNPNQPDGALQTSIGPLINATGGLSFNGMSVNDGGYIPSDNNIAVGPNHIVEVVNAAYAVYSKTGATLLAPVHLGNLWKSLANSTCSQNSGDTVVQYDRVADRWMITQLGSLSSPYSQCIAVSQTNDPVTTAYNLYSYSFGTNLNDYPKFGVWPTTTNSAYLATYNLFANGASFAGAEICTYDRTAMLAGAASPASLCFTGINGASFLPVDLDGSTPPLDGTPAYFMDLYGASIGGYTISPNFSKGTATLSSFSTLGVPGYSSAGSSPQPGTTEVLDSLSDRMMYRLAFRMFSDHESIVTNHSVVGSTTGTGVRWYELRSPLSTTGAFSLYQSGTFSPDGNYRWMGSAAMDQAQDIAIGYSLSNGSSVNPIYPSVAYTGRIPSDTLGSMETEATIISGSGSQTGYTRWGDYSSLRIDPGDDCTFWYVNEYYPATASYSWYTRIGSFKFSNCTSSPDFSLAASPTSASVTPGQSPTSTITASALNGYTGTVNLSVTAGCPSNATCLLSSPSVTLSSSSTSATSTLTVATTSSTLAGTYNVTVNGTDSSNSSLTHNTTFTVTVNVPNFSISASPTSFSVTQGYSNTSTISLTSLNGFSGSVTLSLGASSTCPTNAICSFNVNPVLLGSTGSSVLTITPSATTPTGKYSVVVTGTSGSLSHPVTLTVTVGAPFTMPTSLSLSVTRGSSNSIGVSIGEVNGYMTSVTLSISALPKGVTAKFSSNPVTSGGSSTLTISVNRSATKGTKNLTINGTNGSYTQSTALALTIN
jgi:hypothetical protein